MKWSLRDRIVGVSVFAWALCACAAPIVDVLSRPAVQVVHPEKATLIGASDVDGHLVVVGERGIVALSSDEGRTWRQSRVPVSVTLTAVQMVDPATGFAVGHGGVVLATTDGGRTWRKLVDGIQLAAVASKAAQASGDPQALKTAQMLVADGADKPLLALHFFDAQHGFILGSYNLAFLTGDGGQTWEWISARFENPKGLHLYDVAVRGSTMLVVGEQGSVYLSDDGGQAFRKVALPYKGSLFVATMPSDDELVVAGLRGNVWRSTDRGTTWVQVEVPHPVSIVAAADRTASAPLLANQAGELLVLHGDRVVSSKGSVATPLNAILSLKSGRLLVLGGAGAVVVDPGLGALK